MAERNFDEGKDRKRDPEKEHKFTLAGREFHALPYVHPKVLANYDVANDLRGNDSVLYFLRKAIVPTDRESFEEILESPDIYVEMDDLIDVFEWLIEVYTGKRPTNGSGPSSTGPESTGDTSEPTPSEEVTT